MFESVLETYLTKYLGAYLAGIERALSVAGVPASITADELPLHEEPAVAVLLTLIEIAARPRIATPERIEDLLLGPIGRMDVSDLRRLGRALRAQRRDAGAHRALMDEFPYLSCLLSASGLCSCLIVLFSS